MLPSAHSAVLYIETDYIYLFCLPESFFPVPFLTLFNPLILLFISASTLNYKMGVLGTSKVEEEALRAAAEALASRASVDQSASSQYETASEFASASEFDPDEDLIDNRDNQNETYSESVSENNSTIQEATQPYAPSSLKDLDDDEIDYVMPIQHPQEIDVSNMDENELNRIVTTQTGGSLGLSLQPSRTHGEFIDPKDLDWDGPDDKENPFNWSKSKKWFITFVTANVCLCVSLGSSLFVEGVPELEIKMGISQTLGLSGLTFYLIGLALGPVIAAPLSEMVGRRYIYILTFPASMLFTMGVGLSKNIRTILVLRFFAGFIASPPMSLAGGTISDIWGNSPIDMSIAMALFCVAPFLGPVIGPIVGGFAAEHKGWKWTMWVSLMFSGAILPFLLLVPETYKLAILRKRAKSRGVKLVQYKFIDIVKLALQVYIIRPVEMLFVEPIVGLTSLYIAFVFAVLFGFFEAFPIIFRGLYRMDFGVSGLPFLAVGIGLIFGVVLYVALDLFYYYPKNPDGTRGKRDENGNFFWDAPERKLTIAMAGSVFLPIALFWLAWTAKKSIHWIAPTLAGLPFGFGLIWVFFGIVLYYSMSFPPAYVASALAANNLLRYLLASVFPLFMVQMYERLHIDWATTLLAFISLAMVPIPFAFKKYGPKLRAHSKYGYVAFFKKIAAQKAAAAAAAATPVTPSANDSGEETAAGAASPEKGDNVESNSSILAKGEKTNDHQHSALSREEVGEKV